MLRGVPSPASGFPRSDEAPVGSVLPNDDAGRMPSTHERHRRIAARESHEDLEAWLRAHRERVESRGEQIVLHPVTLSSGS